MTRQSPEKPESSKSKSPAKTISEAMELDDPAEIDSDIPTIDLDSAKDPGVILGDIKRTLLNNSKFLVQKNLAASAVADSEAQKIESERRRETLKNPSSSSVGPSIHSPGVPASGGLYPVVPINDRVALIKATLSTFTSDEARAKWIEDHRDWFESPSPTLPSFGRRDSQPKNDPTTVESAFNQVGDMFFRSLEVGRELQKNLAGPSSQSPGVSTGQSALDVIQIVDKFKEMNDSTNRAFESALNGVTGILKAVNDEHMKERSKFQEDLLKITREKYDETSKLAEEMRRREDDRRDKELEELKEHLRSPPPISLNDIKAVISQARDSGVPISAVTPEREAAQRRAELENRKWEHQVKKEERDQAIELARINQKTTMLSVLTGGIAGVFGPSLTKKHNPSSDAKSVSSRL